MLKFRPHHFLCTIGFEGKGYSPTFVENYLEIDRLLKKTAAGDDTVIGVTEQSDSICAPCPSRRGEGCESQEKIDRLDGEHSKVLGLAHGDQLSWKEAKKRIAERMSLEAFHKACEPCSWKALGVCEKALILLRTEFKNAQNLLSAKKSALDSDSGIRAGAGSENSPLASSRKGKGKDKNSKP